MQTIWGQSFSFLAPLTAMFGGIELGVEQLWISGRLSIYTTRKPLLQFWKYDKPPTFDMQLNDLKHVLLLEKIRFICQTEMDFFFSKSGSAH